MADAGMGGEPGGAPSAPRAPVSRRSRALPPLKPVHIAAIAVGALFVGMLVAALWPRDGVEVPGVVARRREIVAADRPGSDGRQHGNCRAARRRPQRTPSPPRRG